MWDNLRKVLMVNTPINNAQGLSVLFGMIFGSKAPILRSKCFTATLSAPLRFLNSEA